MTELINSLKTVGLGVLEIFLISFIGFFILNKKILTEGSLKTLSSLIINITFPFLIFSNVITRFNVKDYPDWWVYPLGAIALVALGCALGFIVSKTDYLLKEKREFIGLMGFQNASYLPLPLVAAMFPKPEAERYFIYIFMFILGYIPIMSSIGVVLITGKKFTKSNLIGSLTPPFYAIVISLILAGIGIGKYIPNMILHPIKLLGDCTIPLAMVVLGGVIYVNFKNRIHLKKRTIFELVTTKLILLPVLVLFLVRLFNLNRELSFLLVLESTMPSATTLVSFAKNYNGNYEFIGQSTFYLYLFSLITIPLCIVFYTIILG
jgi:predicted permease